MVAESRKMTVSEYLAFERAAESRHEFYHGEVYAMTGASLAHGDIVLNLAGALRPQLRVLGCRLYATDVRVKVAADGSYTYPDLVTVCGAPKVEDDQLDTLLNPTLIVEVLSDSTERYDRGRKFGMYRAIPSLREYLLVAQHVALLEHYTRQSDDAWILRTYAPGDTLRLHGGDVALAVDDVYRDVFAAS